MSRRVLPGTLPPASRAEWSAVRDAEPMSSHEIDEAVEGLTVPGAFLRTVAAHGELTAVRWKSGEGWDSWSYRDFADRVAAVAAGLQSLGVGSGDRVLLMMRNIPQFHVVDMAAAFCGATPLSVYNSSSPDQIAFVAGHSGTTVAVVEDAGFADLFAKAAGQIADLRHLVVVDPEGVAGDALPYDVLAGHAPIDLDAAAGALDPDSPATIIYTSGTTGDPKGVVLSHRNVCWMAESIHRALPEHDLAGKRMVSYLPMAHIAERMVSLYAATAFGAEVTTCPDTGLLAEYFRETRPHIVFGVPRVWEKVHAGINAAAAADPEKAKALGEAVEAALEIVEALDWGTATEEQLATYDFLDQVAFSTVRQLVGLDEAVIAVSGAAPLTPDVLRWFRAVGVPLSEIYGMSESTGAITWAPTHIKPGTVGPAMPGVEVALADDGEVLFRGSNVFSGYLGDPERTAETIDDEGWVHTGDVGVMDDDGYLRIVDRKKELIITAGGKNVSPANLEVALKSIPLVGQACAIGDDRPYIVALVTLDPDAAPAWAASRGLEGRLAELAETPEVIAEVEAGLAGAMAGFSHAEQVKKVKVLGEEWLPDSDVLTPTSKLKRRGVNERYAAEIEALYST